MVCAGALHFAGAVSHAAPEIAAADDNAHLDAHVDALLDHVAHFADHIEIQAKMFLSRQRFSADLQQDPFILGRLHSVFPPSLFLTGPSRCRPC